MGLREARRYVDELRKKQKDPYSWPDFLTGLPDRAAVIAKLNEIYPTLGKNAVSYVMISGIDPYLIKYGSSRHLEIIQWAAAALKTAADVRGGFIGAFGHDFVVVSAANTIDALVDDASGVFARKAKDFYSADDFKNGKIISYKKEGESVEHGLMKLAYCTIREKTPVPVKGLIPYLRSLCP